MINLLVEPIKANFGLSDLQISLLQGAGFSIAYLIRSPIFGRWIDNHSRRATSEPIDLELRPASPATA